MGKIIIILWMSLWIAQNVVADEIIYANKQTSVNHSDTETSANQIHLITALHERFAKNQNQSPECMVNSSIDEFPNDIFTNEQRLNGFIALHILGAIYFFTLLAVVCNDYFLPSVECICSDLNISKVVKLEWWPITRDSILYSVHLLVLILFAWDSKITLYESIVLVILYFMYFVILFQNTRIRNFVTGLFTIKSNCRKSYVFYYNSNQSLRLQLLTLSPYLLSALECLTNRNHHFELIIDLPLPSPNELNDTPSRYDMNNNTSNQEKPIYYINGESSCQSINAADHSTDVDSEKLGKSLWIFPNGTWQRKFWWTYTWPIKFILTITIPSPKTYKKLYPLSFVLCIVWIGINSYLIVWMMTVVGYTFAIPENVMGLTLLAAGGCMPEAISSVLMIRKGESGIGVSNSLGANSLAILMSLGVPWLIRNLIYQSTTDKSFIVLNSYGVEYTIASLLVATILLYVVLAIAKYRLNKKVGFSLLTIYAIFLTLGILMELDVLLPSGNCA
ncbi:hypothetical protein HA402_006671 [Bradysia odoriphaga]|nr:hypothetical protein HA402_006671 [Bradysia odoriphaga]